MQRRNHTLASSKRIWGKGDQELHAGRDGAACAEAAAPSFSSPVHYLKPDERNDRAFSHISCSFIALPQNQSQD